MAVSVPRRKSAHIRPQLADVDTFEAFPFAGHVPISHLADFYGLAIAEAEKAKRCGGLHC